MDWNGPNQGKLRRALLKVYSGRDIRPLRRFIRDNFPRPLNDIADGSPENWAGELIENFGQEGLLDDLYAKFCQKQPDHSAVIELQSELRGVPLIENQQKVDVKYLFSRLSLQDLEAAQKAFLRACKDIYGDLLDVRSDRSKPFTLDRIQPLIEHSPRLAVQFAEHLMVELSGSNQEDQETLRNVVKDWRDRITQSYGVTPIAPQPAQLEQQGYLLIALKECARKTGGNAFVTVFSELCVTGEEDPVEFGAQTVTCALNEVAAHLSALIYQAETALSAYGAGRVTLELFLPCEHLDLNVADWEITNRKGRPRLLGKQRSFIVRSLERAADKATQAEVKRKWQFLEGCVEKGDACDRFHPQEIPLVVGDLEDKLKDKPGLKLLAELPRDRDDYLDILDDIIESGVPIALWFSAVEGITATEKLTEFDALLQACSCLTDFYHLANQWRTQRQKHPNQHLRVLCDCPDRWPAKPFYTDPLIAS